MLLVVLETKPKTEPGQGGTHPASRWFCDGLPEAGMAPQDVAAGAADHQAADGQNMEAHLDQNVLETETSQRPDRAEPTKQNRQRLTCMAKSVVRHPTLTSAASVQSDDSIFTCLMLLGVIQPSSSSDWSSASPGSALLPSPWNEAPPKSCKPTGQQLPPGGIGPSRTRLLMKTYQEGQQVLVHAGNRVSPEPEAVEVFICF